MAHRLPLTALCVVTALTGCGANNHEGASSENGPVSQSISHDLTTPKVPFSPSKMRTELRISRQQSAARISTLKQN